MTKDLIVIVPGITGSILKKDGKVIWGVTPGAIWRGLVSGGLDSLRIDRETGLDDLNDGVTVEGIMPDVHMIPGLWKIDGYSGFAGKLAARLERTLNDGVVYFPYDWRRDNRVSARAFAKRVLPVLHTWRAKVGPEAKLTIIAHSMGGLISRYFIECLEGWKETRQLITFGTPYRGSLNAVGFLSNGFAKKVGPVKILDATAVLRSFNSVYQLLPTYECVDDGSGVLHDVDKLKIPGIDQARAADARRFHEEIEDAVARNAQIAGYKPVRVTPLLSSTQTTFQSAKLNAAGCDLLASRNGKDEGGDGTVPMVSAIMQRLEAADGFYIAGIHGSLQAADASLEFSVGQLKAQDIPLDRLRADEEAGTIKFQLDDGYEEGTVPLEATVIDAVEPKLLAEAVNTETNEHIETTLWPDGNRVFRSDGLKLSDGIWRITLQGQRSTNISDLALVAAKGGA